jgi:uncharacterized protein YjiS (DUF1127 family)
MPHPPVRHRPNRRQPTTQNPITRQAHPWPSPDAYEEPWRHHRQPKQCWSDIGAIPSRSRFGRRGLLVKQPRDLCDVVNSCPAGQMPWCFLKEITAMETTTRNSPIQASANFVRAFYAFCRLIRVWQQRRNGRLELRHLDSREISDFCQSSAKAYDESHKPFWRE